MATKRISRISSGFSLLFPLKKPSRSPAAAVQLSGSWSRIVRSSRCTSGTTKDTSSSKMRPHWADGCWATWGVNAVSGPVYVAWKIWKTQILKESLQEKTQTLVSIYLLWNRLISYICEYDRWRTTRNFEHCGTLVKALWWDIAQATAPSVKWSSKFTSWFSSSWTMLYNPSRLARLARAKAELSTTSLASSESNEMFWPSTASILQRLVTRPPKSMPPQLLHGGIISKRPLFTYK